MRYLLYPKKTLYYKKTIIKARNWQLPFWQQERISIMKKYEKLLRTSRILPIKCPENMEELETMLSAIMKTPLRVVEITLRNGFALDAIKYIKQNYPEIIVGAGTVVNSSLLNQALKNGADFCVSPGLDFELLNEAKNKNMPFLPGCSNPSEILMAQKFGLNIVKFFPAEISGGVEALKLYEGAFSDMLFLPTGGITIENAKDYLKLKNVVACGGSFMIGASANETCNKILSCLEGVL